MIKTYTRFLLACLLLYAANSYGQVTMSTTGSYTQDFNTLANTGSTYTWTDNSTIANWYSQRTGSGTTYTVGTGSSNAGALYSFGSSSGNTERALGTVGSGNAAAGSFAHGLLLKNTSGAAITNLTVAYTGEQWRVENAGSQTVAFYYKISSSAISALNPNSNSTWTAVTALDFTSPKTNLSAIFLDGNAAANRTVIAATAIPSLNIPDGYFIMIKWDDPDHTGSDHGLAIDDVTVNWTTNTITTTNASYGPFCNAAGNNISVAFTSSGSFTGNFFVQISDASGVFPSNSSSNLISSGSATSPITATIPPAQAAGTGYRVRVVNSAPATQSSNDNGNNITVTAAVTPNVSISISTGSNPMCAGAAISFSASPTNGGASPSYQWKVDGVNDGTGNSYTPSSALTNGQTVTCVMTSNATCVTSSTATSTPGITVTVNPLPTLTGASQAAAVCDGSSATINLTGLVASSTNNKIDYSINGVAQTQVTGVIANPSGNASFTTAALTAVNNGQTLRITKITNGSCSSNFTQDVTLAVNPIPTPSFIVSPSSTVCNNTNITYTTDAGMSAYTWSFPSGTSIVSGGTSSDNSVTLKFTTGGSKTVTVGYTSAVGCPSSTPASSTVTAYTTTTSIFPASTQTLAPSTSGAALSVSEGTSPVLSREWKYGPTSGPYTGTGNTTASYTPNFASTGTYFVVCVTTYDAPCGSVVVTSNEVEIDVVSNTLTTTAITFGSFCNAATNNIILPYTHTGTFTGHSDIQISNSSGVFPANATSNIVSYVSDDGTKVTATLPSGFAAGTGYRVRVVNSSGPTYFTSGDNGSDIAVTQSLTPSVTIAASPSGAFCAGTNVSFTATPTNGGSTPAYQWQVNGSNAGTNNATFTTNGLTNGQTVTCILTSNASCVTPPGTATSTGITVTVNPLPTLSGAAQAATVCAGSTATINLSGLIANSSGNKIDYTINGVAQTQISGVNADASGNGSFTSASLTAANNGQTLQITKITNGTCSTNFTQNITLSVNPLPTLSAAALAATACEGSGATINLSGLVANSTNNKVDYTINGVAQTQITGVNADASGNGSFTSATLTAANNGQTLQITKITNGSCSTNFSKNVTLSVKPLPTLSTATQSAAVCENSSATINLTGLVANSTNNSIDYTINGVAQTQVTGVNANGSGNASFTTAALVYANNGQTLQITKITNGSCSTNFSKNVTLSVIQTVVPSVSITSDDADNIICLGTSVKFTATPTNGGASPSYQWKKNGTNVGTNSATYTTTTLASGDVISCVMTSNAACASPSTGASSGITMTVNALPSQPGAFSPGPATVIQGQTGVVYTVPNVGGVTYSWSYSGTGATISGSGNSVTIDFATTATSGTLSVTPTANGCAGPPRTLFINCTPVNDLCSNAVPLTVNGGTVAGTLSGATVTAGNTFTQDPTGTDVWYKFTPTCNGPHTITLTFTDDVTNDIDILMFSGSCPTSGAAPLFSRGPTTTETIDASLVSTSTYYIRVDDWNGTGPNFSIEVKGNAPAAPASITGSATPCIGASTTYTVPADAANASSFTWTIPSGWTGTSTTNSITVTPDNTAGSITVKANNCYGSSPLTSLSVTPITTPGIPASITGNSPVCEGTVNTYSIAAVSTATSYTWTLPGAWTGSSTTTSISATSPVGASSGNITVKANNACGSSAAQTTAITVNTAPANPVGSISDVPACGNNTLSFSGTAPGGDTYYWQNSSLGSSTALGDAASTYTTSASGNYYVRAKNANCWSIGQVGPYAVTVSSTPVITVSTPTIASGFDYDQGTTAPILSFNVSGACLTADLVLTAPTDYEVSKDGLSFSSSVSFTPSSGTVASSPVYVRLKTTLTAGLYNSKVINATSSLATTKTVTCSGTVYQPNNNCNGASTLTVNSGTTCTTSSTGSVRYTTQSLAAISCGGNTGNADDDVWYKFTATNTTHYISVKPTDNSTSSTTGFDVVLEIMNGSCPTPSTITCADAFSEGGTETATATGLTIGATYYARVYEYKANSLTVPSNPAFTICVTSPPAPCTELFISEYELGLNNDKAVEIYNPTSSSKSLTGYNLKLYNNGASSASSTINLSGTIAAYGTWVVANPGATGQVAAMANQTSGNINFDANDAFALYNGTTLLDVFGRIGEDPTTATGWVSGSNSTLDVTLVRSPSVQQGVAANPTSGFPTLGTEWIAYELGETSYLGTHYSNCDKTVILTGDLFPETYCVTPTATTAISVPFTTYGTFNSGNTFTAQLSNASGSFASPVTLGTLSLSGTDVSGSISGNIPANTATGTNYKVRVIASNPATTPGVYPSRINITINLAPQNVTSASAASIASGTIQLGWTNPACYDEILVISCSTGPVTTVPTGDGSNYNMVGVSACLSASCEDVIYKGGGSTVTVSGLDNGTTYYFKIWTRKGTDWSTGVALTGSSSGTTIISAGDFAVVGINSNNGGCSGSSGDDNIYFVCFKDITSGTTLDITDNGWEACNAGKFNNTEGFYRVTYTGSTITAGTIIKWSLPGSGRPSTLATGWAVTYLGTNNVNTNSSSAGGDQIFFLQGGTWYNGTSNGSNNATYTNGRYLFAFNTKTTWGASPNCSTTNGRSTYSKLPADVACFSQTPSSGTVDYILYTGSTTTTDKYTWISRLLSPGNWTSSYGSCSAFNTAYASQFSTASIAIDNTNISTTWTGAANTNWYDCQNWNAKQVPDESVSVTIPNVTNKPKVDYTATYSDQYQDLAICKNLTIQNGSSLTVEGNALNYLGVYGDLTINSGGQLDADDGNSGTTDGTIKIYGNWINQAGATGFLEGQSKVIFGGAATQSLSISGGATIENFNNLSISKKTQTYVTLNNSISTAATGVLEFQCGGYINANGNTVSVLNPARVTAITGYDALNSTGVYSDDKYVYGSLERAINTTGLYDFPIGDIYSGYGYNPVQLDIKTGSGNATAKFIPGDPGSCNTLGKKYFYCSGVQKFIDYNDMTGKGWWNFLSSTATTFSYDIYLHPNSKNTNDNPNENAPGGYTATYRALKGPTGTGGFDFTPYVLDGDPCTVSNTYYNIVGAGYSGFSDFAPAGGASSTTPLPVELIGFTGNCIEDGRYALISWNTASERNSKEFVVQHSVDGTHFSTVAVIPGAGFSNIPQTYSVIDSFLVSNNSYYRLVEMDNDGSQAIYSVIQVRCSEVPGTTSHIYYASPKVVMELNSPVEKQVTINLFEVSGKVVHHEVRTLQKGYNKLYLDIKKQLSDGIYILETIDDSSISSAKIWVH